MKKICILIAVVFYALSMSAQGLVKGYDTRNFPQVVVKVHSYNPDTITKAQVKVREANHSCEVNKVGASSEIPKAKTSSVLFLLDLRDPMELQSYCKELVEKMYEDTNIYFNYAMFGCRKENGTVYESAHEDFVNAGMAMLFGNDGDGDVYEKIERNISESMNVDLCSVLEKAIAQINQRPDDEAKAIILLSAGGIGNGAEGIPSIVAMAKEKRVQIYVVTINGNERDMDAGRAIAEGTYGLSLNDCPNNGNNGVERGFVETVNGWVKELPQRWVGIEYFIKFTSNQIKRTGEEKTLKVELGTNVIDGYYRIPSMTFGYWIKTHVLLFIVLLVVFLAGTGVGGFFLVKYIRKRVEKKKKEAARRKVENERIRNEQDAMQKEFMARKRAEEIKQEEEARKKEIQQQQEKLKNLNELMRRKNIKARLIWNTTMGNGGESVVTTAECLIGRDEEKCDIVINDLTVSGTHAKLIFNGEVFKLIDMNSKNGMVINGFRVKEVELKNGDQVSLGKAVIKFYI